MLRTGLVIDTRYQDHQPGQQHPERPARIGSLLRAVESYRRPGLTSISPRLASEAEIGLIHDTAHIGRVAATAGRAGFAFDADTQVSALSYDTARLATGGLLAILDAVMDGEVDNGFGLVRPPGHHAERNRAMERVGGFPLVG